MTQARPDDDSLSPDENPAAPGSDQGSHSRSELPAGQAPRFTADIMLIGSGWREPGQPEDLPSPSASPDALPGVNGPHAPGGPAGASESARAELEAAFGAGFTYRADRDRAHRDPAHRDPAHRDPAHRGGAHRGSGGFAAGGVLDRMLPGTELGGHLAAARRAGYGGMSDYEVCGALAAQHRQCSHDAWAGLVLAAELDARRAGPGGHPGEHVEDEVAALLRLTRQGAAELLGLARDLRRLPQTATLLAAGVIDRKRAELIAAHLAVLSDEDAVAVEEKITPRAGEQTTGELGSALARAVKAHDPHAAARRREKAQKDARVEVWAEPAGTAALAGRDLPPAGVIEATKSLDADTRWLKAHGVEGSFDELRAKAFAALLAHKPLTSLIPATPATPAAPGGPAGPSHPGTPAAPGAPAAAPRAPDTVPDAPGPAPGAPSTGPGQAGPRLGGTVHLTMPATTWLGASDNPGDIPGIGPTDADTCRDLATTLAANPATRWCITLTDPHGRAVAHGCARAGPGPPGYKDRRTWLATVTITPIAATTCDHRHQSAGYQPSPTLRHLVKTRSPRCGYPGCRRPAWRCDDDHTVPHHKGGRTCECNLHPLCRHHHQTKQAPGWHLAQPRPGVLVWTTPSGRKYTTTPEPYPT